MRIFIAGATGVVGGPLVSRLLARGDHVSALTRREGNASTLRARGVEAYVADIYDRAAVIRAVKASRPDVVMHQLTALPKRIRPSHLDADVGPTNRLRTEGTDILMEAALAAKARRFVAQSISFVTKPAGASVLDETAPLYLDGPAAMRSIPLACEELEQRVTSASEMIGIILRYGFFYGPGTVYDSDGSVHEDILRRRVPIVGDGGGIWSFIHVDDAADAAVCACDRGDAGIYNVTDDEPAPAHEWIPHFAKRIGAASPMRVPKWIARPFAGAYGIFLMTELRGASNEKAKRLLEWRPTRSTWRDHL